MATGQTLAMQAHPAMTAINKIDGLKPKNKFWYVVGATEDACIWAEMRNTYTQHQLIDRLHSTRIYEAVNRFDSIENDSYFIPSGRLHAASAGNAA